MTFLISYRLRVHEIKVIRKIFVPKED